MSHLAPVPLAASAAPSLDAPPRFSDAANLRQKAWAAGLDPSYWYPVEHSGAVKPGQVIEVQFLETSVALLRARDGRLAAMENRCAHRQVKLSLGRVSDRDCALTCRYHGWTYGMDGKLESIPHELFGKAFPQVQLRSYPVQERYGFIWVFFGDAALAEQRPMPRVPEIEGCDPWLCVPIDFTVRAHPAAIINNVMDSTHVAALHRKFRTRSMIYGKVTRCEAEGDRVTVSHDIRMDPGGLLRFLVGDLRTHVQDACYDYPYLWVGVGGVYKLWNFMLPIDRHTTRLFMLSCAERVKVPFTPYRAPSWLTGPALRLAKHILVTPLFTEDVWSFEAEQEGYERHYRAPAVDPHPAIRPCYQLTIRKWEEHLSRKAGAGAA